MIVVVETNFIVELVLQQEQSQACENILALCASSADVHMVIPAFAVAEAGMLLERRTGERRKLIQIGREIPQLPDAIVLASLKGFLEELRENGSQVPVLFTTRDDKATRKPFGSPIVLKQLRALGCRYEHSFVMPKRGYAVTSKTPDYFTALARACSRPSRP